MDKLNSQNSNSKNIGRYPVQMDLPLMHYKKKKAHDFYYIENGIKAEGHTPVYKMHKYFARRPQNVFRQLIEFYSNPDDIVLDCFCGGGVTVFEGLSINRKIIGNDINPLASFVSDCQTTLFDWDEFCKCVKEIKERLKKFTDKYFITQCRDCGNESFVRWYDSTYLVTCDKCSRETDIRDDNKLKIDGKSRNGKYVCSSCSKTISAVDLIRQNQVLLNVRYKCSNCNCQKTAVVNEFDINLLQSWMELYEERIFKENLWIPENIIPDEWDRQKEDCLYRKGFKKFTDFFTKRNLYFNAKFLKLIQFYKEKVASDTYKIILFLFSATLRYNNNLTISTKSWMDGRPVAWAKHAFWTPNQFVEVNPIEYFEKRYNAIRSGNKFQRKKLTNLNKVDKFKDLHIKSGTHIIWNSSSTKLDIPDNSIDMVLTDPPYGSNVQYGELSSFWLVWLKNELNLPNNFLEIDREILVHRKTKFYNKDYRFYYKGLLKIFRECYRVLQNNCPLVFTFNSKNFNALFAVLKAAIDAGFFLSPEGVVYQEPIEIYKNTAHTRYSGSIHGDFIYTFIKKDMFDNNLNEKNIESQNDFSEIVRLKILEFIEMNNEFTTNEIYIGLFEKLIPDLIKMAQSTEDFNELCDKIAFKNVEYHLNSMDRLRYDGSTWVVD